MTILQRVDASAGQKSGFSRAEWRRLAGFYGVIGSLHVLGCGVLLCYAPQAPALAGLGFAACMLGLRHAFDADDFAAVDDTVRYSDSAASKPAPAPPSCTTTPTRTAIAWPTATTYFRRSPTL